MEEYNDITRVWQLYEQGRDHHNRKGMYSRAERCYQMYEGDQWAGISNGVNKDELPKYNFIKPVVNYKVASIAMNSMTIHYTPMGGDAGVCNALNEYAARKWEHQKLDSGLWEAVKAACIVGDAYLYFYNRNLDHQLIDATNLYLGDEQQPELQKQPYILIYERRLVSQVKEEARQNGLEEDKVALILPDDDTQTVVGDKEEIKGREEGKCSCLLYLTKREGTVHFSRSTRLVEYQPDTPVDGLSLYPMASLIWERSHNSARGVGEVWPLIPNQIEANKTLFRRQESMKAAAFPKMVYVEGAVENPERITEAGTPVIVRTGTAQRVKDFVDYLAPASMSGDAPALQNELIDKTRDLANAGDAALGNINPENASGAAIVAVRDAQAVPLNEQESAAKQFVEDIALIWYDMFAAYSPNGLYGEDGQFIATQEELRDMKVAVRIDVSPRNPWSKYAQEQAIENALGAGHITFEEYVAALDDDANAPKAKFKEILEGRIEAGGMEMAGGIQPDMMEQGMAGVDMAPVPSMPQIPMEEVMQRVL